MCLYVVMYESAFVYVLYGNLHCKKNPGEMAVISVADGDHHCNHQKEFAMIFTIYLRFDHLRFIVTNEDRQSFSAAVVGLSRS